MLALVSSITTLVNGCDALENCVSSTGLPSSVTMKSSRCNSGTSRPLASMTVAYTGTSVRAPARKTCGSCAGGGCGGGFWLAWATTVRPTRPSAASFNRRCIGIF